MINLKVNIMNYKSILVILLAIILIKYNKNELQTINIKFNKKKLNYNHTSIYLNQLKKSREFRKCKYATIFIILFLIVLCFLIQQLIFKASGHGIVFIIFYAFAVYLLILRYLRNKYIYTYREEIVKPVINHFIKELTYNPEYIPVVSMYTFFDRKSNINNYSVEADYKYAEFDRFSSLEVNSYMTYPYDDGYYYFSDIKTYKKDMPDKSLRRILIFSGIFSIMEFNNNFNNYIYFFNKKIKRFKDINYIDLNNKFLKSHYDIYSDTYNNEFILELANVVERLRRETGIKFEFKIYHNNIAFRFFVPELFKPSLFFSGKRNFYLSITIIKQVTLIIEEILKILNKSSNNMI